MKKHRFTIIVVGLIISSIILIIVLESSKSDTRNMAPVEDQELIYFGDEEADNEILFLFDYACHWCSLWANDIYPVIEADYINTGEAKFRTQVMTYVNEASQRLAKFDQNVKNHAAEEYEQIFHHIIADTNAEEVVVNWGTDEYITDLIDTYQLDSELMTKEAELDPTQLSNTYNQALQVDVVPTLYINGIKVEDTFDLEEIDGLLK